MKNTLIIISIAIIIALGIFFGIKIYFDSQSKINQRVMSNEIVPTENIEISAINIHSEEEKTTPNTLMIYKTYYTKCMHFIQEYEEIDASLVNCTEEDLREKCKDWKIDSFSREEVELSKEEDAFCNQHYQLRLENNVIVVYQVDENGIETEYEQTGITTEFLTEEDILKLTTGIFVYGKENLISTIEDYE